MNNLPEPPPLDADDTTPAKYTNWPSAEGYEVYPEDFKASSRRPVPALRCTHERDDGSRCKNFGIRGSGIPGTGMPSMCFIHGGSLPAVKAKAEAIVLSSRMRLYQNADLAIDTLLDLMRPGTADAIRLKSSTELLDRIGVKGGADLTVEVTHNVSMADAIAKKLEGMRARVEPELQDEGEIVEQEEED